MVAHDQEDRLVHGLDVEREFFEENWEVVKVDQVQQGQIYKELNLNARIVEQTEREQDI